MAGSPPGLLWRIVEARPGRPTRHGRHSAAAALEILALSEVSRRPPRHAQRPPAVACSPGNGLFT